MDFKRIEADVQAFWEETRAYEKAREKNKGKEKFYYLDGPPYTSGRIHIGHAWGKTLRDMVMRYKRMQGFDVYDRPGFDMHGLPTQHKVQEKYGLKSKQDIIRFGEERFAGECERLAVENMRQMIRDFKRFGVWMDWDRPYMPITQEYIEGVWWLVKQAYEQGRLYEGLRTLAWDPVDESALAKHELEYKTVTDESVYFLLPLKDEPYQLLVWTTTPWTIPFNMGVMIHPDEKYAYVHARKDGREYKLILAEKRVGDVMRKAGVDDYEIMKTIPGSELVGKEYTHPFEDLVPQYASYREEGVKLHRIVPAGEFVSTSEGTGLVHSAPGCGPEDFEVGWRENLPPFNTVDEKGYFKEIPAFEGLQARKDDPHFIKLLKERDAVFLTERVTHEYPHAERSKAPAIFRVTKQWFLKIEDLKPLMLEANERIHWVPDWAGKRQFANWLKQLRDNSITKQIHWGTPLPVWRSREGDILVIGSVEELKQYAKTPVPDNLHKPWIDSVVLEKDGKEYYRIPDVLDVWVDAGSAAWLSLDYPRRKDLFDRYYPADFITEGKDQIRGWFNLLMQLSILAFRKAAFKAVYMTGFVNDALGRKMSKSLGNIISPDEVVEKHGADVVRFYFIGGTSPGEDLNYNHDDVRVKEKNLMVLFNLYTLAAQHPPVQLEDVKDKLTLLDEAMLSRIESTLQAVTRLFDDYQLDRIPHELEALWMLLSKAYVQTNRERLAEQDPAVYAILQHALRRLTRMLAPLTPHLMEHAYQQHKTLLEGREESVHHESWPKPIGEFIKPHLESLLERFFTLRESIIKLREAAGISLRQPLAEARILLPAEEREAFTPLIPLLQEAVNVKHITLIDHLPAGSLRLEAEKGVIGKAFREKSRDVFQLIPQLTLSEAEELLLTGRVEKNDYELTREMVRVTLTPPEDWQAASIPGGIILLTTQLTPELEREGRARSLARLVQEARKKTGLTKGEPAEAIIQGVPEDFLTEWADWIAERTATRVTSGTVETPLLEEDIRDWHVRVTIRKD